MHRRVRLVIATAVVTLALGIMAGAAAGETIEVTEPTFLMKSSSLSFEAAGATVRCPVTLEGTYQALSFSTTSGSRVGSVTRASAGTCTGGSATALSETLPWSVNFERFAGTLPAITSLTFNTIGARFRVRSELGTCEIRSTESAPLRTIDARSSNGVISSIRADETVSYALGGGFPCEFSSGRVSGTGSLQGILEEGRTNFWAIAMYQQGAVDILREEAGGPLRLLRFPLGGEGTLSVTKANVHVLINSIIPFSGNSERFMVVFGSPAACMANAGVTQAMPVGGCNIKVRNDAAANVSSRIRITYQYAQPGNLVTAIQEFPVQAP